jgi:hypothetical protein
MSPEDFRRLALALPGVIEASHMHHPDFRVGKRIFATLGYPDSAWAMVKLKPEQQALVVTTQPEIFVPVKGGWGARGSTSVKLGVADEASVSDALRLAWQAVSRTSKAAPGRHPDPSSADNTNKRSRSATIKRKNESR